MSSSDSSLITGDFNVVSPNSKFTSSHILSRYSYTTNVVQYGDEKSANQVFVKPVTKQYIFRTERKVPRLGLMLVGWGGNNGSTITAGILSNKHHVKWNTKDGERSPDYIGSLTQSSTIRIGSDHQTGKAVYTPFRNILPMVHPNDLVLGGWDISSVDLASAMERARVIDYDLQQKLRPYMQDMRPLPSIYDEIFIAANQKDRADNVIQGTKEEQMNAIRKDIRDFKRDKGLDKVIVLWTANTERFCAVEDGLNDTADNLLRSISSNAAEISPSTLFACASVLEGCSYLNGSPQNTFVPGLMELAERAGVFIGGDDFKSGQTKMKSVLVDFLVSAGIKPVSIVSYNHLGNNDGKNLSAPEQFRSKEISKSNVVDDMVASNRLLYPGDEDHPDHCVVIKYVPYVADSKRAMDEYTSEIFLGGKNTIVMHNTCEDSLLASPIIIDLAILCELCERIEVCPLDTSLSPLQIESAWESIDLDHSSASKVPQTSIPELMFERMHSVLSVLSYLLKAPLVPSGTPVVNALAAQRQCMVNIFRACLGLQPEDYMLLEHKLPSEIISARVRQTVSSSSKASSDQQQEVSSPETLSDAGLQASFSQPIIDIAGGSRKRKSDSGPSSFIDGLVSEPITVVEELGERKGKMIEV